MANKRNTAKSTSSKPKFERPVERYFYSFDQSFQGDKRVYSVFVFLAFFGIMGVIWMIPFPQLEFLQRLNAQTFLNWGSFFIAIAVYSYLKLAPTLSYSMLFTICIMSFFIVQIEYIERDYGVSATGIFTAIAALALIGLWLVCKKEDKKISGNDFLKMLAIGPLWLWSKVFDRLKWKY